MKNEIEHYGGQPVFPSANTLLHTAGLTKRELFAAMAMAGLLSDPKETLRDAGIDAVKAADILLEELSKMA